MFCLNYLESNIPPTTKHQTMLVILSQLCLDGVNSAHSFDTCLVSLEISEMAGNTGASSSFSFHGPPFHGGQEPYFSA